MNWNHRRWAVSAALGCSLVAGSAMSLAQTVNSVKPQTADKTGSTPVKAVAADPVGQPGPAPRGASNDSCATPQSISGAGPFTFNNLNATTGAEGQNNQACGAAGTPGIRNDEWFCWTADCTGLVTISTCGQTQVDTKIAMYAGCACPSDSTQALCCNDDGCGVQSLLRCDVVCGQQYMIQIGVGSGAPGTGTFTIDCAGEPCEQGPLPQCCGAKPVYNDAAYASFNGQVMAMVAETFFPVNNSTYALTIFDLKNANVAPLDVNWNPANFRYNNPAWTKANMGSLFGITLDDNGNLYCSHTTIYNGGDPIGGLAGSTAGSIYRVANGTGTPSVFANLPNNGPGLGNVSWDCAHSQIFASNFEDGRIYRLSATGGSLSAYDHATGVITPAIAIRATSMTRSACFPATRSGPSAWTARASSSRARRCSRRTCPRTRAICSRSRCRISRSRRTRPRRCSSPSAT